MKRILIHIAVAAILLVGCKGGGEGKKTEMSPENVTETFTRHIASGKFDQAMELCDTTSMQAYIDRCITVWESMEKNDSSALAIASSLLAGSDIKILTTEKTDIGRDVYYSIEADGNLKEKKATLVKEEGEWRIRTITDVI